MCGRAFDLQRRASQPDAPAEIADRLAGSVVRPLSDALTLIGATPARSGEDAPVDEDTFAARLWSLTEDHPARTAPGDARASPRGGSRSPGPGGPVIARRRMAARLATLAGLQAGLVPTIRAEVDGPYLVTNVVTVRTCGPVPFAEFGTGPEEIRHRRSHFRHPDSLTDA